MTRAKREAVEEWAEAFVTLTGTRIVLAPEKFARFKKQGVNMALFHERGQPLQQATQ